MFRPGFLSAILIFSALIVVHQLEPYLSLALPGHQVFGAAMIAAALSTDFLFGSLSGARKERDEEIVMF